MFAMQAHTPLRKSLFRRHRFELPTIGVAIGVYGGFVSLTWFFTSLPLWAAAPLGALLLAWQGSLQHETIHGHPTPWRRVNALVGSPPLSLWIPYARYRQLHLWHHRCGGRYLTDPVQDPESFYLRPGTLASQGPVRRLLSRINCTLAGRLLAGPALSIGGFLANEVRLVAAGDRVLLKVWLGHALGVALVLAWVSGICHIPVLVYLGFIVYPATSITLLRSFAEHRANGDRNLRTAVVEANPLLSLIYLNNNLHLAHHALPKLPWYELPHAWRRMRSSERSRRTAGAGMIYRGGYVEIARRYLVRPVINVEHPAPGGGPG